MAKFNAGNREWEVEFDGLLLADVLSETGVDLADLSAGGLASLEADAIKLVKVLAVLCSEQIKERSMTAREFSKAIKGKAIDNSVTAVLRAAEDFFPSSRWSAMRSALNQHREFSETWTKIQPLLAKLNEPEMESMRPAILEAMREMMGDTSLQDLENLTSAGGSNVTPSLPATDSPENVESIPEELASASSS